MGIEIEQPHVLVVEGREEELFFGELIKHLRLQGVQIMPLGGKEKLRLELKALVRTSGFHKVNSLGIVRDADNDPMAAFQSVCDGLQAVGLPVPKHPLKPVGTSPKVAVVILPEENMHGMLEDLCLKAVTEDKAVRCVERYFECLQELRLACPDNMSKAKVQVFLASRRKALRLGEAAQAGYWPWGAKAFEQVREFLQEIGA